MAKETINSIRDAELKAAEVLKKAEADKLGIIEEAKEKGAEFAKDLIGKAEAKAKAELDEVEATREGAISAAAEKAEGIIAEFVSNAEKKRDEAIQMVIDEIA